MKMDSYRKILTWKMVESDRAAQTGGREGLRRDAAGLVKRDKRGCMGGENLCPPHPSAENRKCKGPGAGPSL